MFLSQPWHALGTPSTSRITKFDFPTCQLKLKINNFLIYFLYAGWHPCFVLLSVRTSRSKTWLLYLRKEVWNSKYHLSSMNWERYNHLFHHPVSDSMFCPLLFTRSFLTDWNFPYILPKVVEDAPPKSHVMEITDCGGSTSLDYGYNKMLLPLSFEDPFFNFLCLWLLRSFTDTTVVGISTLKRLSKALSSSEVSLLVFKCEGLLADRLLSAFPCSATSSRAYWTHYHHRPFADENRAGLSPLNTNAVKLSNVLSAFPLSQLCLHDWKKSFLTDDVYDRVTTKATNQLCTSCPSLRPSTLRKTLLRWKVASNIILCIICLLVITAVLATTHYRIGCRCSQGRGWTHYGRQSILSQTRIEGFGPYSNVPSWRKQGRRFGWCDPRAILFASAPCKCIRRYVLLHAVFWESAKEYWS